jgi:hypothetical protein
MKNEEQQVFNLYVHQFALWTAFRAVQRAFAKTEVLKDILDGLDLEQEVNKLKRVTLDENKYDKWHSEFIQKIINSPKSKKLKVKMTYGRAAKMIAIYFKASQILRDPESNLAQFAHPPIDKKLLATLKEKFPNSFLGISNLTWTKFDQKSYYDIIQILRKIQKELSYPYFWMIEKYWAL